MLTVSSLFIHQSTCRPTWLTSTSTSSGSTNSRELQCRIGEPVGLAAYQSLFHVGLFDGVDYEEAVYLEIVATFYACIMRI